MMLMTNLFAEGGFAQEVAQIGRHCEQRTTQFLCGNGCRNLRQDKPLWVDNEVTGIDALTEVFRYIRPNCWAQRENKRAGSFNEARMMKTISAIALLIGMAASVPAFAQSPDPAANAVEGGASGAATGAVIGCLVTIPIGCAPGAVVGAAVGGGVGATAGAASTPPAYAPPPPPVEYAPPPPPVEYAPPPQRP